MTTVDGKILGDGKDESGFVNAIINNISAPAISFWQSRESALVDAETYEFEDALGNDSDESVVVDIDEFGGDNKDASVSADAAAAKPAASTISFQQ